MPAWWSSSNSLVRAVIIASSLASRNSAFFRPRINPVSDAYEFRPSSSRIYLQTTSFETPRQISFIRSARSKYGLRWCLSLTQPGHGSDHAFLLLFEASGLKIFRRLPATHTQSLRLECQWRLAPQWLSTIVQRQNQPRPHWPPKVRCRPSTTLAPRRYFLYSEALKSCSFSRRDLTSATCWRWWLSPV